MPPWRWGGWSSVDIRVYLWIFCTHVFVNPIYLWIFYTSIFVNSLSTYVYICESSLRMCLRILYICESYTCESSIRVYFWILCRHMCIFVCMCVCMYTRVTVLRSKWMIFNDPLTQNPLPLIKWFSHPFAHLLVYYSWITRESLVIRLFPLIKSMILSLNDPLIKLMILSLNDPLFLHLLLY